MRAGIGLVESLIAKSRALFRLADIRERFDSTPNMPHRHPYHRTKVHAPNDGHWHMRFHRRRS